MRTGIVILALGLTIAVMAALAANAGMLGIGLFVLLPFAMGLLADLALAPARRRTSVLAAFAVLIAGAAFILLCGLDGAICILMAAPLALPLMLLGATMGFQLRRSPIRAEQQRRLMIAAMLLAPAAITAEARWKLTDPLFEVRTAIEIDAPPATVWQHVVSFSDLPEEREWLFHTGVAYPKRATIAGEGVGAIRRCEFSTGAFVEPITEWREPELLAFAVQSSAPPMHEWSPYRDLHPPHLDGYLLSQRGQFKLTALPGGRTRLEGTTWYQHHLQPAGYWQAWSDWAIHRIHLRVLRHVKSLAE